MAKVYNQLIERYPIATKASTSGVLFSLGDALTQFSNHTSTQSFKKNHSTGKET
jgi:hypothetical protein